MPRAGERHRELAIAVQARGAQPEAIGLRHRASAERAAAGVAVSTASGGSPRRSPSCHPGRRARRAVRPAVDQHVAAGTGHRPAAAACTTRCRLPGVHGRRCRAAGRGAGSAAAIAAAIAASSVRIVERRGPARGRVVAEQAARAARADREAAQLEEALVLQRVAAQEARRVDRGGPGEPGATGVRPIACVLRAAPAVPGGRPRGALVDPAQHPAQAGAAEHGVADLLELVPRAAAEARDRLAGHPAPPARRRSVASPASNAASACIVLHP